MKSNQSYSESLWLGSNVLYSFYTNAHPFYGAIIKLEKL